MQQSKLAVRIKLPGSEGSSLSADWGIIYSNWLHILGSGSRVDMFNNYFINTNIF